MRTTVIYIKAFFIFLSISIGSQAQEVSTTITPLGSPINTKKYTEYAPTLSADGQVMIFQSNNNKYRVWYLYETRLGTNGKWSKPRPINAINNFGQKPRASNGFQTNFIATPHLSADGNTLYFCATFSGGMGSKDIYVSKRKSNGNWGRPRNIGAPVNTKASEDFPSISPEGDALYFARPNDKKKGTGSKKQQQTCYDLYVAKKDANTGRWQTPQKLPTGSINTGCEKCPRIQSDGLTLVFSSIRDGNTHSGDFDLYKAVLSVKETDWEQLEVVTPLNTPGFDQFATVIEPQAASGSKSAPSVYYNAQGKRTPDIFSASPLPTMLRLQKVINTSGKVIAKSKTSSLTYVANNTTLKVYLLEADRADKPYLLKTIKVDEATGGFALPLRFGYNYLLEASAGEDYEVTQKRLALKDWTSLEYALKTPLILIKKEKAISNEAMIAKNNTNTSTTTPSSNAISSAQKTLLINPKTGEIISLAELQKRARKGLAVSNGVSGAGQTMVTSPSKASKKGTLPTRGEILAAYPEYEMFDGKQQQVASSSAQNRKPNKQKLKLALTRLQFPHLRFAYKSSELSSQSKAYLENILGLLKTSPKATLQIDAHTDHTGTWSSNMRLSEKRAQVVKAFLVQKGIAEGRLMTKAYGEGKPLVWRTDTTSQEKNRRVEVRFLK
ncbi:hypothetical protein BKI52_19335 [marine bacterium AO1-C]|nr:hypothetical protein BKI52_19335 [marine bacterium AO1-C]